MRGVSVHPLPWSALLLVALGCASAPDHVPREPTSTGRTRTVAPVVSEPVARIGGGAYVLRESGELARYDRHGALTGVVASGLRAVVPAGAYLCGLGPDGVVCFRERHEERICPSRPFAPDLQPIGLRAGARLRGEPDRPILWVDGEPWLVGGTCGQHCITLGCDGPRRCMDRCPPGEGPRLFARRLRAEGDFFSTDWTVAVTHPSK